MVTATQLTEKYISEHPSIKDCLKKNVLNYSKLARMIAKDLGIEKKTSKEAILIAARRFARKLKEECLQEERIIKILKSGELEIKNKIVVFVIEKTRYLDSFFELEKGIKKKGGVFCTIEGTKALTVITSEQYSEQISQIFHGEILKQEKDLAMVVIKSNEDIEKCPGVIAHLYSLFADNSINILETMSSWTDTIIIIKEYDVAKIMQFLKF